MNIVSIVPKISNILNNCGSYFFSKSLEIEKDFLDNNKEDYPIEIVILDYKNDSKILIEKYNDNNDNEPIDIIIGNEKKNLIELPIGFRYNYMLQLNWNRQTIDSDFTVSYKSIEYIIPYKIIYNIITFLECNFFDIDYILKLFIDNHQDIEKTINQLIV